MTSLGRTPNSFEKSLTWSESCPKTFSPASGEKREDFLELSFEVGGGSDSLNSDSGGHTCEGGSRFDAELADILGEASDALFGSSKSLR